MSWPMEYQKLCRRAALGAAPSSHLRARARPGDGSEVDSTEPTFLQVTVGGADSELEGHGMTRT